MQRPLKWAPNAGKFCSMHLTAALGSVLASCEGAELAHTRTHTLTRTHTNTHRHAHTRARPPGFLAGLLISEQPAPSCLPRPRVLLPGPALLDSPSWHACSDGVWASCCSAASSKPLRRDSTQRPGGRVSCSETQGRRDFPGARPGRAPGRCPCYCRCWADTGSVQLPSTGAKPGRLSVSESRLCLAGGALDPVGTCSAVHWP